MSSFRAGRSQPLPFEGELLKPLTHKVTTRDIVEWLLMSKAVLSKWKRQEVDTIKHYVVLGELLGDDQYYWDSEDVTIVKRLGAIGARTHELANIGFDNMDLAEQLRHRWAALARELIHQHPVPGALADTASADRHNELVYQYQAAARLFLTALQDLQNNQQGYFATLLGGNLPVPTFAAARAARDRTVQAVKHLRSPSSSPQPASKRARTTASTEPSKESRAAFRHSSSLAAERRTFRPVQEDINSSPITSTTRASPTQEDPRLFVTPAEFDGADPYPHMATPPSLRSNPESSTVQQPVSIPHLLEELEDDDENWMDFFARVDRKSEPSYLYEKLQSVRAAGMQLKQHAESVKNEAAHAKADAFEARRTQRRLAEVNAQLTEDRARLTEERAQFMAERAQATEDRAQSAEEWTQLVIEDTEKEARIAELVTADAAKEARITQFARERTEMDARIEQLEFELARQTRYKEQYKEELDHVIHQSHTTQDLTTDDGKLQDEPGRTVHEREPSAAKTR